jgi:hypothetical protein
MNDFFWMPVTLHYSHGLQERSMRLDNFGFLAKFKGIPANHK